MRVIIFLFTLIAASPAMSGDYFDWKKSITKSNDQGAIIVHNKMIYCNSRKQMVVLWNRIINNSGNYSYGLVKSVWGCQFTQGMSLARPITQESNGLVNIEFLLPHSKTHVMNAWIHENMAQTLKSRRSQMVQ